MVHLQDFLLLEGRKSLSCDITAVVISGMAENSSFPPFRVEENWKYYFTAHSSGGKAAWSPNSFQAGRSISFNIKLATHLNLIFS